MSQIFDAHVHLSEDPRDELIAYAKLNGLTYDLRELVRLMKENGFTGGLLLSPPIKGGAPLPNERIMDLCARSGGLLSPVLTVEHSSSSVEDAVSLARQNKETVKGFKIRLGYLKVFADDAAYGRLYDYAESEDLPVMFHTGDTASHDGSLEHSHPLTLDRLANGRPGLKLVACHFGNPWIADVGELIYKHPNVYADISGLVVSGSKYETGYLESVAEQVTRAIYFAGGAEKVIFGTDYPVSTPALSPRAAGKATNRCRRQAEHPLEKRGQGVSSLSSEGPGISIRDVPTSERESLIPILESSFTGIYLRHARRIMGEVETVRVATLGEEAAGLAMLKSLGDEAGYVYYIAVTPNLRGRGIGSRLVNDSLAYFARAGAREVYASVGEDNAESNALFKGQGFARTDFGKVSKKYGAFKALSMYRSMWVVPGEVILVRGTEEAPQSANPGQS